MEILKNLIFVLTSPNTISELEIWRQKHHYL